MCRSLCIWITGIPAAGKSTLAAALCVALKERGAVACILDGDVLRSGLNRDLDYSADDRSESTRRSWLPARIGLSQRHAIVGLSLPRDGSFSGLQLDDELKSRDADPWCGVQIVSLGSGDIVEWIKLEGGVSELFDVAVIPGVRWPVATGFLNEDIHKGITFEV